MLSSSRIHSVRQTDFLPVTSFSGLDGGSLFTLTKGESVATLDAPKPSADADNFTLNISNLTATVTSTSVVGGRVSAGTGRPVLTEIGATGAVGLLMTSALNDVRHFMKIPSHWDRNHKVDVRFIWSSEAAAVGARDITWVFKYAFLTPGTTAIAAPVSALTFAAQAPTGTAKVLERSPTAKEWDLSGQVSTVMYLHLMAQMSAFNAALSENKYLIGLEFEYTPRLGRFKSQTKGKSQLG
jgi:hypothetical protein